MYFQYPALHHGALAFVSRDTLWISSDRGDSLRMLLPEPMLGVTSPHFSPDGQMLAFVSDKDLYHISIEGGMPERLTFYGSSVELLGWKDDKNLWYFKSPAIENVFLDPKKRYFVSFTMTSFMGDFTKINKNVKDAAIIIKTDNGDVKIRFPEDYDGKTQKIMMPIEEKNRRVESIMILGDWTRGIEMLGLDDVKIISYE